MLAYAQVQVQAQIPETIQWLEADAERLPLADRSQTHVNGFISAADFAATTAPGRLRQMCQNYPRQPGGVVASCHAGSLEWQKPL